MVDYYAELDLDRSLNLAGLQRGLARAESVWKQRRTRGNPAAANKKLALIDEARSAFSSEAARAEYDRRLSEGDVPRQTPSGSREFDRWADEALRYYQADQADLAVAAVERALAYAEGTAIGAEFHMLAARCYRGTGDPGTALRHANEAILLSSENPWTYIEKAFDLFDLGSAASQHGLTENALQYEKQLREAAAIAAAGAEGRAMREAQGAALGILAFSLYFREPCDPALAEDHAKRAVALDDPYGNGQTVIDSLTESRRIERERAEQRRLKEEREAAEKARREEERRAQAEKAHEERVARIRAEQEAAKAEEQSKQKARVYALAAWVTLSILGATSCTGHLSLGTMVFGLLCTIGSMVSLLLLVENDGFKWLVRILISFFALAAISSCIH